MVEQLPFKEMVPGSSPGGRTRAKAKHTFSSENVCFAFSTKPALCAARVRGGAMFLSLPREKNREPGSRVLSTNIHFMNILLSNL